MNKLGEIKRRATETMVSTRNNSWSILDNLLNDVFYLLGQIEEKDKALEQFADEDNWIDIWDPGAECCKREWAPFGNPADIARAALKSTKEE